ELARGVGARETGFVRVYALVHTQRTCNRGHHRLITVGADPHFHLAREINSLHVLEKAMHEGLARLLAVADDLDPATSLKLERKQGRVTLALFEGGSVKTPGGP